MQCNRGTIQRATDFKDDGRANLFLTFCLYFLRGIQCFQVLTLKYKHL